MLHHRLPVIMYVIQLITTIAEVFLGLRLVLKLLGANAVAPFVAWIYNTSEPLLTPFQGMFPSPKVEGVFLVEFSTLFAIVVYSLTGYLLTQLVIFLHRTVDPDLKPKATKKD